MIETVLDAHDAERRGYLRADVTFRHVSNMAEIPNALQYLPIFAGGRDNRTTHQGGYPVVVDMIRSRAAPRTCVWLQPLFSTDTATFCFVPACLVFNPTGAFLGLAQLVREVGSLSRFLSEAATTPNTQIFVVGSDAFLVAATTRWPTAQVVEHDSGAVTLGARCASSILWSNDSLTKQTPKVVTGCREAIDTYPYQPLQSLWRYDADLVLTPTRRAAYQNLDGDNFYVVSVRVTDPANAIR